jgi:cellulose synthase/poly-beta-1,6-N-acetylglucosamine synthase-like glycosyltransferase
MLFHALVVALIWLLLSAIILLIAGRRMGGPAPFFSIVLMLAIEGIGSVLAIKFGIPRDQAIIFAAIGILPAIASVIIFPDWNPAGHAAMLFLVEASVLYLGVAAVITILVPTSLAGRILGLVLLAMQCMAIVLTLSYTHELIDVVCRRRWRRIEARPERLIPRKQFKARGVTDDDQHYQTYWDDSSQGTILDRPPLVALQVPCHEEPPNLLEETLWALAQLDYPRDAYQVFVVDNNTRDLEVWEPVEALCDRLGFTFLHLERWPGFKSGALNYALAMTPPEFEIIGVVDADYLVEPGYLRDLVPYFADNNVAFVQTPQDYRDYGAASTLYQRACYHSYRYFFDISMPSRNERNAIIFGGTMGLIRADALREIGGWDEWCITEDAEASLRLLTRGYEGRFINQSYGRGVMPLEFDALKRQRFRWCFGGIQILRKHWAALLPWIRRPRDRQHWEAPGLTGAQRYHYLLGGLQWYGDTLTFGFTTILLCTGWLRLLGHPLLLPVLGGPLLLLPLAFWITSLLRMLWGLRATRRCTWIEALSAVGIMWSLGWVVTLASVQGLVRKRGVFLRTPKGGRTHLVRVLRSTTMETLLAGACLALGLALFAENIPGLLAQLGHGEGSTTLVKTALSTPWWLLGTSTFGLATLAFLQGLTYLTAPSFSLLSLRSEGKAREQQRHARAYDAGDGVLERRLMAGTVIAAALVVLLLIGSNLLPQTGGVTPSRSGALSNLLGNSNPVAGQGPTPTAGSSGPQPTPQPGTTPTGTGIGGPALTSTAVGEATATTTPRPGATPSPQRTPPAKGTPTPRPHP